MLPPPFAPVNDGPVQLLLDLPVGDVPDVGFPRRRVGIDEVRSVPVGGVPINQSRG